MKTIKILVLLLTLCVAVTIFACGSDEGADKATTTTTQNSGDTNVSEENASTPESEDIPFPHENIPNFNGATLKILIDKQWSGNSLDVVDYSIEEMTGDVLNDAYYQRNSVIEEMFNVKLEGVSVEDIATPARKTIQAGIDEYSAMVPRLMNAGTFATNGYGVNVFDTKLSLDKPWWDQNIINDTSIDGAAYFIAGDIFIKHYDGISLLMFNKRLLADLQLESPYTLVNDNQWTMDKFNSMVKAGTRDLDGDGVMGRYDQYGFNTQADYVTSFINASGEKLVTKDNSDLPVFTGNSEKIVSIVDKMLDVYVDDTYCMHRDGYGRDGTYSDPVQFWIFPEGRSLFYWAFPRYMDLGLRDMEDSFGIVPIPKWDSNQDRYYAAVNNWHAYSYMIPITVEDVDSVSILLDAMAYHGRKIIKPAYYDVCLQRKYTRDEESSAMLDIIFSSTVYDLGTVYGIGEFINQIENGLKDNNRNDVIAGYEKNQNRIATDINKLIEKFENNKN